MDANDYEKVVCPVVPTKSLGDVTVENAEVRRGVSAQGHATEIFGMVRCDAEKRWIVEAGDSGG